jgi:hypothetical protein
MHLAPLGNAQQYCSVYDFQLGFRRLFFSFNTALPKDADRFGASMGNAQYKGEKKTWILLQRFAYLLEHCLLILLYWGGNGNT